jgi:hypothetical protein
MVVATTEKARAAKKGIVYRFWQKQQVVCPPGLEKDDTLVRQDKAVFRIVYGWYSSRL